MRSHIVWMVIAISAVTASVALLGWNQREETALLEQIADRVERLDRVHPATKHTIETLISQVRRGSRTTDASLYRRQQAAMERIEVAIGQYGPLSADAAGRR